MRRVWRSLGVTQPTVAGGAQDLATQPWPTPDRSRALYEPVWYNIPLTILAILPEEGVDQVPFLVHRWETAATAPPWLGVTKRSLVFRGIQISTENIGLPLPVVDAPPETTPVIPIQKEFYHPIANLVKRRAEIYYRVASALSDANEYSLPMNIPAGDYNFPVCLLLDEIQRHVLEAPDLGVTWADNLWTQDEVIAYLNQRIAQFMLETGVSIFRSTIAAPANQVFYSIGTDYLDIRRLAWASGTHTGAGGIPQGTTVYELPRVDSWELDNSTPGWQDTTGSVPQYYVEVPGETLRVRLYPVPTVDGTLDITGVRVRSQDIVTAACSSNPPIPTEWVPYVKWGVLADMLSKEGEANDPQRAALAEQRFKEGVLLARTFLGANL